MGNPGHNIRKLCYAVSGIDGSVSSHVACYVQHAHNKYTIRQTGNAFDPGCLMNHS